MKTRRQTSNELLLLLARKEDQWHVVDKVVVRNLQNGLVSFELTESYGRYAIEPPFYSEKIIVGFS